MFGAEGLYYLCKEKCDQSNGRPVFYSIRSRVIASLIGVSFLVGAVSLVVGGELLNRSVLGEARNRVSLDLNAAREVYGNRIKLVEVSLHITTLGDGLIAALKERNARNLILRLSRMSQSASLDFAGIVNEKGETLCRIGPNPVPKSVGPSNEIAATALSSKASVSGTFVLSKAFLQDENPDLAGRARIPVSATAGKGESNPGEETSGMAIAAAIPIFQGGQILGVLYGGILLNQNYTIVDTVRDTVFLNETYKNRGIGVASIFLNDIRISTNVLTEEGRRAIGSKVSKDVRIHVLERNERWTDRALVINDWYITAYEALRDARGKNVGIIGVGVLERKYMDLSWQAVSVFALITLVGMALAAVLGIFVANRIMKPVRQLIKVSQEVSGGNLSPSIGPMATGEIGLLQKTFEKMIDTLRRRHREAEDRLLHSEKQAGIGRLAAGVAHEINNPLTGILTYTHMLLRRNDLDDEVRSDLVTVAEATDRVRKIVRGLLDFSRETKLNPQPTDLNSIALLSIPLMRNQASVKGVEVKFNPAPHLAMLTLDRSQFQSVLLNILLNALDATEAGGKITVSTNFGVLSEHQGRKGVEISVEDTGCGIPTQDMDKLFDPFFTTKEVGKGTGLGLSVSLGIVQRHGGTITVKSEVGKGSKFTIWLPVEMEG